MKIGLIAVSGIRACDQELVDLGLTFPGFMERSMVIASLPSLGLLTLAALTPSQHEVVYREVRDLPPASEPLEPFDLVAISTLTAQVNEAYRLADRYRANGTAVVMGGLHVTAMPAEAALHCDSVVGGEGETSWPRLIEDFTKGHLKPRYCSASDYDLSDSPIPAFHLLALDEYNRLPVQTSRGCPWRCEFCASSIMLTRAYKQKPVENVVSELDRILELWPRPFVEFADDNSLVDRRYWRRLLPELASRRIRWFAETDLSIAQDEDFLDLIRESGCTEVLIGLESPVEAGLQGLETKVDWKRRQLPRYREAVREIQAHGIRVNTCFVIGLDGQGPEVFSRVVEFVHEVQPYDVQITVQTPFPGSGLYDRLKREGRLHEERPWDKCTLFDVTYEPTGMTAAELRCGFRKLAATIYSDDATRRRREAFKQNLRRLRRKGAA